MTVRDILMSAAQSEIAGSVWSSVNIRQPFIGIIWANNQFVAVGTTILTSPNGSDWTERSLPVTDVVLRRVIWSGTQYVAVGTLGAILTSPDGIAWTARTSGTTAILNWVVWSGTQYVTVGDSGTILTSPDGITWTIRASGVTSTLYSIVWSGSQFVVGGSSYTLTSANGVSWIAYPASAASSRRIVLWSGGLYTAAGPYGGVWSSSDGINWTQRFTAGGGFASELDGFWSGGQFFFLFSVGTTTRIVASADGISWTEYPESPRIKCFTKNPSTWVGGDIEIFNSTDLATWSSLSTQPVLSLEGVTTNGTDQIVAVGVDRGIVTSPDGLNWTLRVSSTSPALNGVVWSGTQYVAVGGAGLILTSPDGINWTQRTSGTSWDLRAVAWSGGLFVAVGGLELSTPGILISSDGINWTSITVSLSTAFRSVIWANNQFIAGGIYGVIVTSPNGINWTQRISGVSGVTAQINSIAWSGSRYIATGVTGSYLTSIDSINWSTVSISGGLFRVFWTGRIFVGVQWYQSSRGPSQGTTTSRTRILISTDGINWQTARAPSAIVLLSLTNFRDRLFLVGSSGQVMTSPGIYAQPLPKL